MYCSGKCLGEICVGRTDISGVAPLHGFIQFLQAIFQFNLDKGLFFNFLNR